MGRGGAQPAANRSPLVRGLGGEPAAHGCHGSRGSAERGGRVAESALGGAWEDGLWGRMLRGRGCEHGNLTWQDDQTRDPVQGVLHLPHSHWTCAAADRAAPRSKDTTSLRASLVDWRPQAALSCRSQSSGVGESLCKRWRVTQPAGIFGTRLELVHGPDPHPSNSKL